MSNTPTLCVAVGDKIEKAFELKMKMIELRRESRASYSSQKYKFVFWPRIRIVHFDSTESHSSIDYTYSCIYQYHMSRREERLEDEERKETSDLCSPNSRVVFQSLFPIRGVINILMRLPFGRVAGKRTEISSAKSRSQ